MNSNLYSRSPINEPIGLGLRDAHIDYILENRPKIGWLEILADNLLSADENYLSKLELLRSDYPFSFHSVGTSIGSTDPLNYEYLKRLRKLILRFEPGLVSEHLCWSGVHGVHLHDLFPLPFNEVTVKHVSQRIEEIQEFLGRTLLIENVSAYAEFDESSLEEYEFITEIALRSGSKILLDINNIYINSINLGVDLKNYLEHIPAALVKEMHLAGGEKHDNIIIDSHNCPVWDEVWELYSQAVTLFGAVPTLIEWDNDIPEFRVLQGEAEKARHIIKNSRTNRPIKSVGNEYVDT